MALNVYELNGITVDIYAGPLDGDRPRRRIVVSSIHPDTGRREVMHFDLAGWQSLAQAIEQVREDETV